MAYETLHKKNTATATWVLDVIGMFLARISEISVAWDQNRTYKKVCFEILRKLILSVYIILSIFELQQETAVYRL